MNEMVMCADCKHFSAETCYCKRSKVTVCSCYGCCEGARTVTNADKIRALSDDELAEWMSHEPQPGCGCLECWQIWLQQPANAGEWKVIRKKRNRKKVL